jgi:photosystem II stability/assembly factor-like uncharacterized protein
MLLSIVVLFFFSFSASAQWTQLTQDTNNYNCCVFFINPDTGFISGDYNGQHGLIQRTTDGGQTWSQNLLVNIFLAMNIEFPNDTTGYCIGQSGLVYKTVDMGTTWLTVGTVAANTDISAMHFLNKDTGLVVDFDGRIFRTTDGAASWNAVYSVASGFQNFYPGTGKFRFVNDSVGFLASGNYGSVMKTTDYGATWTAINLPTSNNTWALSMYMFNKDTGIVVGEAGRIWKTVNGGTSWSAPQIITPYDLMDVIFFNDSIGYIVGGENSNYVYHPPSYPPVGAKIFATSNGGQTWSTDTSLCCDWFTSICNAGNNVAYAAGWHGWLFKNNNALSLAGVSEFQVSSCKLFPNPVSSIVEFPLADHAELIDVNGRVVLSAEHVSRLNVSEVADGMYVLRLKTSDTISSEKIVVRH